MDAEPQSFDRVLSSMCTPPHPVARDAAERFLATNPGDPGTYPTVADLEDRTVDALGDVVGLDDPSGYVAGGGTEANIQAVRIARELGPADPNVVVPESAHFSFHKAADLLSVELRTAPLEDDLRVNVAAVEELIDDRTAGLVGIAGTTEYGRVDPIPVLSDLATENDLYFHVDAAYGGFELPFTDHEWNFEDARIDTMTIDPHKRGRAAIPAGGLLAREPDFLDALSIRTPYLESASQITLTGTRSGAGVASAYAAIEELWPEGYRADAERSMANAEWLAGELAELGYEVVDPVLSVVAAAVGRPTFERLRDEGWRISRTEAGEIRVVCMPHVTREMLESFVADLRRLREPANMKT